MEKKEGGDGSRSILSSGFIRRRVCYARTSWRRLSKRRRRDRRRANDVIAAGYFIRRARCQGQAMAGRQIFVHAPSSWKVASGLLISGPVTTNVLSVLQTKLVGLSPRGLTAVKLNGSLLVMDAGALP